MNYLLVANLSFIAFFAVYMLLLRRLTFFGLNRLYLLIALVFSAFSPFFSIGTAGMAGELPVVSLPIIILDTPGEAGKISPMQVAGWVYWAGVAMAAAHLLHVLYRLLKIRLRSRPGTDELSGCFVSEGSHAFSFFNRIEIGDKVGADMLEMIVAHESVHRRQWHSADVLLYALARVFCWFNPFVYLAFREVQLNHEFLADRNSHVRFGTDYQYGLLNHVLSANCFPLTNSFFSTNSLKNRILMMNKKQSGRWSLAMYTLIVPAVICSLWLSSCEQAGIPDQNQKDPDLKELTTSTGNHNEVKHADMVDKLPEFPGGEEGLLAYFKDGFNYPDELKKAGIEGLCTLGFVVNEDGSISDVEAVRSDHKMLEPPAIAFVENMPDWTPGEMNGNKVKVKMHLPVKFTMN